MGGLWLLVSTAFNRRTKLAGGSVYRGKGPRADRRPGHLVDRGDLDVLETGFCHQLGDRFTRPVMGDPRQHLIKYLDRGKAGEIAARALKRKLVDVDRKAPGGAEVIGHRRWRPIPHPTSGKLWSVKMEKPCQCAAAEAGSSAAPREAARRPATQNRT